ncbi:MATE family efflux transporter [Glaciecola punicea]|uniref:MATE family efflux transporter n=1 Tax=Glaciecola punicea TaxID=56804 RepID=UPI000872A677|nr:MATE family efflux transporter [Glaciecola punicea]OFA31591.1 MATE family efflux transporter [Glaciecola punicea]
MGQTKVSLLIHINVLSIQRSSKSKNDMLKGDIKSTLINMAIPMIFGMIMLMTFGIVDTFFVSLIGTNELAAISFTFPITFLIISFNIGLGIGTSAVIGKYLGSGDDSNAKVLATGSLMLVFILVGMLSIAGYFTIDFTFTLLGASATLLPLIYDYMSIWYIAGVLLAIPMVGNAVLRASGDTKTPSIIMAAGGGINVVLTPVLIFGYLGFPALGIKGAAIATCIAWTVCVVWIIYFLAVKRELMEPRLLSWSEFVPASKGVLTIGLPAAGSNMLTPISAAIVTSIVAGYGAHAVAAWGVGNRIESLASIVVLALSMSLPPLISQNFGANQFSRIHTAYRMCIKFILVWQFLMFVILVILAPYIASVFAAEESVAQQITLFLLIVPIGYGFQGIIILTNSAFNAMHKPLAAMYLSLIRLFICYVPITALGSYLYGLQGLFWACVVANALAAGVSYYWFNREIGLQKQADKENYTRVNDVKRL